MFLSCMQSEVKKRVWKYWTWWKQLKVILSSSSVVELEYHIMWLPVCPYKTLGKPKRPKIIRIDWNLVEYLIFEKFDFFD